MTRIVYHLKGGKKVATQWGDSLNVEDVVKAKVEARDNGYTQVWENDAPDGLTLHLMQFEDIEKIVLEEM